ncbi:MAG: folylpolyglutamate synthase/dihydrofolate synthase family protein [Candidatus Izemoplasmatales bacterium]
MFTSFNEAKEWIENSHRFGDKLDLNRMNIACEILGHPQRQFKSIHVAGTNGKGSTANYLKNAYKQAGYRCGIYTSPYVVKFNERMGVGDEFISDEEVLNYANELLVLWNQVYQEYQDAITFFEILTLMSFLYFRDHQVDLAIVEVGLGGLLDATNVITPMVSVITNISFDHMKQLGNTLESIAMNKLGIVKQGIPLITTVEQESLKPLFRSETEKKNSLCIFFSLEQASNKHVGEITSFDYQGNHFELQLPGEHQITNALLAIQVIEYLNQTSSFYVSNEAIYNGLKETKWPGRIEIVEPGIILDGAHNTGGAIALKKSIQMIYPDKHIKCLFCMMKDKEHQEVINLFDSFVSEFHFTEIEYPRRAAAEDLMNESHHPHKYLHHDFKEAIDSLRVLKNDEILLITGSLYFISEARAYLKHYHL